MVSITLNTRYAICLLVLMTILYTEHYYEQTLFDKSLDFIPKMQEGASDFKILMWSLYSNVGLGAAEALPLIICLLIYQQRPRSMYYVVVIGSLFLIMNVTKLYYH